VASIQTLAIGAWEGKYKCNYHRHRLLTSELGRLNFPTNCRRGEVRVGSKALGDRAARENWKSG
jgi:hypothetical protein